MVFTKEEELRLIHCPQLAHTAPYDIRIWQCTDFNRHWHGDTEIYICLQGQMKICIEGTMYRLYPDDTVFVACNEAHEIFCDTPDTRVILIAFGYALLGSNYSNMQESVLADWRFRSSLYAIAGYISEHKQIKPVSAERLLRAKQLERMSGTLQYISAHFQEPITVEQAATVAGYDRSYFCKQFRKITGMTFHHYLNYYRISVACQLLVDAKLPLFVVAEQSGFSSQKNLSRLFREMLGMPPNQYRKLPWEVKNSLKPL